MVDEPAITPRKLAKSASGHSGWSSTARKVAGTNSDSVGWSCAAALSHSAGSKRGCSVTLTPDNKAGSV